MTSTIRLTDGRHAVFTTAVDPTTHISSISVQYTDAAGQPVGSPQVLAQGRPIDFTTGHSGDLIQIDNFAAAPLTDGGFELTYYDTVSDTFGFSRIFLKGVAVTGDGHVVASAGFSTQIDFPNLRASGVIPDAAQLQSLPGDRVAVVYETFDSDLHRTTHLTLTGAGGAYATTTLASRPDEIIARNGDITLSWHVNGSTETEVLG
ncbi:MAG TPA: hypothetical protein VGC92_09640, partial [Phenylobacterium sp.]